MLLPPRCYRDERDLGAMLALLQAGRAARISSYYVHTGDLKWWLYYPPIGLSWWDHIYLWEDSAADPALLGWALIDPAGGTFDVYAQPALWGRPAAAEMLAWAEEALRPIARSAGSRRISMCWVTPEDRFRVSWLEERGYRVTACDPALSRSLEEPIPESVLPAGFEVRPCRGLAEVEARALAQYGAFESTVPFDAYVQRFARFMQSPAYETASDLVAAAPDGSIAAFCITWVDPLNRVGLFEPVGTHPEFQRLGLGKAVMLSALRRLLAEGMQQAIVCTGSEELPALRLYASVGFREYTSFRMYSKAVG